MDDCKSPKWKSPDEDDYGDEYYDEEDDGEKPATPDMDEVAKQYSNYKEKQDKEHEYKVQRARKLEQMASYFMQQKKSMQSVQ